MLVGRQLSRDKHSQETVGIAFCSVEQAAGEVEGCRNWSFEFTMGRIIGAQQAYVLTFVALAFVSNGLITTTAVSTLFLTLKFHPCFGPQHILFLQVNSHGMGKELFS